MARTADPLARYKSKRDFAATQEPAGRRESSSAGNRFVVQKHEARRMHWDFRLEADGVLKSWAVTRGPSADPADKRLAVRTEDHPLSYADFEGVIPKGEYGGGTVMLWDRGTWAPVEGKHRTDLDGGHLHFRLDGERMKGEWILVRLKPRAGEKRENWLLRKVDDPHAGARGNLVDRCLTSVATGRSMADIAAGRKLVRARPPPFVAPQLATLVDRVPDGNPWMHEIKFDGYRALAAVAGNRVKIYTRTGLDWSARFAPLCDAFASLDLAPALIDGEITAPGKDGNPSFSALQAVLKRGHGAQKAGQPLDFHAFDLLALSGEDLTGLGNLERKQRLAALLERTAPPIHVADHVVGTGEALLAAMCDAGQEGIISKRTDAPYRSKRTMAWLKVKCTRRQEFVIVGWAKSSAKSRPFASLLLAQHDEGTLAYKGKVGTGFDRDTLADLAARLARIGRKTPPLEVPGPDARGATWVRPTLVAEIAFAELTSDGLVRHASFVGLRSDKPAGAVRSESPAESPAETPAETPAADAAIRVSSRERVIFPESGQTKGDLADYYAAIAPLMLPHVAGRPVSLVRCPQGRARECFVQKHDSGSFGASVHAVPITEKAGGTQRYLYFDDAAGLLACVQMGTIEFHAWPSHVADVERPDRMVFDLDPDEGLGFGPVRQAAFDLRDRLAELGLASFAMLSGGKGVHVVVPLTPAHDWDAHKDFAKRFAHALSIAEPARFVATMSKARRKGRIFIDWLRNQRGATSVAPYSARARAGAPVAAPVAWDELADLDGAGIWRIGDATELLARSRTSSLAGWGFAAQTLPAH